MERYFGIVCLIVLIGGCSSTGGLNVLSPTMTEDEVKERVRELPVTKLEAAPGGGRMIEEKAPPESARTMPEETKPRKERAVSVPASAGPDKTGEALINLLERKGIINREELSEEIERIRQKSK